MPDQTAIAPREGAASEPCLATDIALYRALTTTLTLPPTAFLLLHMGFEASALFDRHGGDAETWRKFRRAVTARYPDIPAWTSPVALDGRRLASTPERLVYEAISASTPPSTTITVDAAINPNAGKWRADFVLQGRNCARRVYVEVAGLLASDRRPRTATEAAYAGRLDAKLAAYAAAGLPAPAIIYVDEVCNRTRLGAAVSRVLAALEGRSLSPTCGSRP
jgi:hypothetical protein